MSNKVRKRELRNLISERDEARMYLLVLCLNTKDETKKGIITGVAADISNMSQRIRALKA